MLQSEITIFQAWRPTTGFPKDARKIYTRKKSIRGKIGESDAANILVLGSAFTLAMCGDRQALLGELPQASCNVLPANRAFQLDT